MAAFVYFTLRFAIKNGAARSKKEGAGVADKISSAYGLQLLRRNFLLFKAIIDIAHKKNSFQKQKAYIADANHDMNIRFCTNV